MTFLILMLLAWMPATVMAHGGHGELLGSIQGLPHWLYGHGGMLILVLLCLLVSVARKKSRD